MGVASECHYVDREWITIFGLSLWGSSVGAVTLIARQLVNGLAHLVRLAVPLLAPTAYFAVTVTVFITSSVGECPS